MNIQNIKRKLGYVRNNPKLLILRTLRKCGWIPDKFYIQLFYLLKNNEILHLSNPNTFNEKLNWLKLYYRKPIFNVMADKYDVKKYVADILGGGENVVKNYGVWDNFDDIDWESLPNSFILKCTHDSGGICICRDKTTFDYTKAASLMKSALLRNCYNGAREWPYKDLKPRIIADELLDDGRAGELQDYKFWCFNGKAKVMYMTNKGTSIFENFYDMDFNPLSIDHGFPRVIPEYAKPKEFETMKTLAEKLSKNIPFVRVDFFDVNGHIYFGEFTFYDWAGTRAFVSKDWDKKLGSWIELPK